MKHLLATVLLAACATAAACGTDQPPSDSPHISDSGVSVIDTADTPTADTAGGAVPATCEDLHDTILQVPATRSAFEAEFGQPDSVSSRTEPNRHLTDAVDSLFTVYYPGLVLEIRTPRDARDMPAHVVVRDNRYLAYPGIGVGTATARLEQVLGEPAERGSGYVMYQCSPHVEQPVTFRVSDGRVEAILISYYVD